MKNLIIIFAVLLSANAWSQVSFNAGASMLKGFSPDKPFGGFHLGFEVPRDDAQSFYGRYTHMFNNKAQDPIPMYVYATDVMTIPYTQEIEATPAMNYHILEGGTRYYLGNGFDYGWAGYGGTNMQLIFNKVSAEYSPYDEALYEIDDASRMEGSIFSFGFGLAGGVKYSSASAGTFYMDVSMSYMILAQGSTNTIYAGLYNPLLFGVNIGYRKDLFW